MMKERKPVDPLEERDKRKTAAVRKLHHTLHGFIKDMETLKLIPDEIIHDASELKNKLDEHL